MWRGALSACLLREGRGSVARLSVPGPAVLTHAGGGDGQLKYSTLPGTIFIDIPLCRQDHQNMDFWIIIASIPRLLIHLLTWYDIKMATLQSCYSDISLIYFLQWNIGDRFRAYRVSDNFKINLIVWMTFLTAIKTPTLIKKNQE